VVKKLEQSQQAVNSCYHSGATEQINISLLQYWFLEKFLGKLKLTSTDCITALASRSMQGYFIVINKLA
jgi:hypothetical protein